MILLNIIEKLNALHQDSTIYAKKPWNENSETLVLSEPDSRGLPTEAKEFELEYFLEVSIARDFVENLAASLNTAPTTEQKCLRLIHYAINDA